MFSNPTTNQEISQRSLSHLKSGNFLTKMHLSMKLSEPLRFRELTR
ncbi:unnamed protein product [Strongylus vulgaris]|uniref:Uncharacterized protein n=1 Tax=Strongylus vulgaris TaxID=40348 RepID=A0A3P7JAL9_STRVU|nr:unnamed protein product [Strongylus vulgaris]